VGFFTKDTIRKWNELADISHLINHRIREAFLVKSLGNALEAKLPHAPRESVQKQNGWNSTPITRVVIG